MISPRSEPRFYQDRWMQPPPSTSAQAGAKQSVPKPSVSASATSTSASTSTIPSVEQFKSLMSMANSDIRLRNPTPGFQVQVTTHSQGSEVTEQMVHARKEPPKVKQDEHGDVAVGPDGRVDYSRIPRRPPGLPDDVDFQVNVEKGRWYVRMVEKKKE